MNNNLIRTIAKNMKAHESAMIKSLYKLAYINRFNKLGIVYTKQAIRYANSI